MYNIAVITSTRAEYGLLRPVLKKIEESPVLKLDLIVTGAHLSQEFGNTVKEIEEDGLPIGARLDFLHQTQEAGEGRLGTARRTAAVLDMFARHFAAMPEKPKAVLLLGDRYEIFAAAQAAALLDIPVAHISGGDVTAGADDDWFRHCITKMAKLHFPSCEAYRQRLLRMGEQPSRVFNVGGLGDENARSMELMREYELSESLSLDLSRPYALVTFHPETLAALPPERQAEELLAAVEQNPQLLYLFTKANADAGGSEMNLYVEEFCRTRENAVLFSSLGALRYLSAMKYAALVLGNSSSGVVETPSFGVPAVDIGNRQAGRITGENVLHCPTEAEAISKAIRRATSAEFKAQAAGAHSPYNGGDTSSKIVSLLEGFLGSDALCQPKEFYDGEAMV